MANPKKSKNEIATIDCALITIETSDNNEFGFETASEIAVEPQMEETEAIKLIIKKKLKAQKPASRTLTGNQITLTDNVFNPELVKILQGGEITYDTDGKTIKKYTPPTVGSDDTGEVFKLNAYSAQYNAAGQIVSYEKITYPNCTGVPVAFSAKDDEFRVPSYTINSAPDEGEAPYTIEYVTALPTLTDPT